MLENLDAAQIWRVGKTITWLVGRKQSNLKYCGLGSNSNRINFILFHLTLKYNCIWIVCMDLHPVMLVCAYVLYIKLYIKEKQQFGF